MAKALPRRWERRCSPTRGWHPGLREVAPTELHSCLPHGHCGAGLGAPASRRLRGHQSADGPSMGQDLTRTQHPRIPSGPPFGKGGWWDCPPRGSSLSWARAPSPTRHPRIPSGPLSPVRGGEGWGEGVFQKPRPCLAAMPCPHIDPLTLTLSPPGRGARGPEGRWVAGVFSDALRPCGALAGSIPPMPAGRRRSQFRALPTPRGMGGGVSRQGHFNVASDFSHSRRACRARRSRRARRARRACRAHPSRSAS